MPPDTLLSLPKSQVKRQEVISGECSPEVLPAAKDASQCWLRPSPGSRESSCFPTEAADEWATEQTQCKLSATVAVLQVLAVLSFQRGVAA